MKEISLSSLAKITSRLNEHPLYSALSDLEDLKGFMEHHVYSVWDFMSLAKKLQEHVAPTRQPWMPNGDGSIRRFINEVILEEESDEGLIEGEYLSHFEIYLRSMEEVGADTQPCIHFVDTVEAEGVASALNLACLPDPSRVFTKATFEVIESGEAHKVAAAFALGRESIIPSMFRSILEKSEVVEESAPTFHFYLSRHVELDEGHHGPMAMRLLNELCDGDPRKISEAIEAAEIAIENRLTLWDGVLEAIRRKTLLSA